MRCHSDKRSLHSEKSPGRKSEEIYLTLPAQHALKSRQGESSGSHSFHVGSARRVIDVAGFEFPADFN